MQTLRKKEIINHKKKIDQLFKSGNRFIIDEFQLVYSTEKYILKLKDKKKQLKIAFIYNSEKVITYKDIEEKINLILLRLLKKI